MRSREAAARREPSGTDDRRRPQTAGGPPSSAGGPPPPPPPPSGGGLGAAAKALCFAAGLVLGIAGLLVVDAAFKSRSPGARRNAGSFAMAGFGLWVVGVVALAASWFSGLLAG